MTQRTRLSSLEIVHDWRGQPIGQQEVVRFDLALDATALTIDVRAPLHGDPPPPGPAGSFDGLWNHEVVELFLLGDGEHYLEIELGPWGHYLVLELSGRRCVARSGGDIDFEVRRGHTGWTGRAVIPAAWIPKPVGLGNAYAIHGLGPARRYRALHPVSGPQPDFHRLEDFGPIGI